MSTVRFSTIMVFVIGVAAIAAVFGCSPKAMHDNDILTLIGKASGIFGCQGCNSTPDIEEIAAELLTRFDEADADNNGQLSMNETLAVVPELTLEQFSELDADGNGSLDQEELGDIAEQEPDEGENEPVEGESQPGEELTVMLPGGVPLTLVRIPAGTFLMGLYPGEQNSYIDENPQHSVTLSQDFYMGKYELTKRQWQAVMGTTPWSGQIYVLDDLDSPAVYVSWYDAASFITALNTHITNTGQGTATFRLPSEAEWEYSCRAGTTTRFYWGDDPSYTQIGDYAWYYDNAYDIGEQYAHVVGLKLPNAFELYDMTGNVWEWCQDWYGTYPSGSVTDPTGPTSGSHRLLRGGSWDAYDHCRSARRYSYSPVITNCSYGFRVARTP